MSAKVARLGEAYHFKDLRGNMMFASIDHILRKRASQIDELFSILCVAYYFIFGTLPWIETIEYLHKKQKEKDKSCHINYYQRDRYIKLRLKKRDYFDNKLIESSCELAQAFFFIITMLQKYEKTHQRVLNSGMAANLSLRHVYERLLQHLPNLSSSMENQQKKARLCSG